MLPMMTVRIAKKAIEADDIALFELTDPNGANLPPFSAGSHIDVEVAPGLVRQYSLCNDPAESGCYLIGVLKDPASRGGSTGMHDLVEGRSIRISVPRNHFGLARSATRTVLFAGGIGITPILSMAERLSALRADFELHYCARSLSRMAFRQRIISSTFAGRAHLHFDDGDDRQKLNIEAALGVAEAGTHIYVCGPSAFMAFVLGAAAARGFLDGQLHREFFSADHEAIFVEGGVFQLKVSSTGQVLDVPSDRTVIDVLREHGIDVPTSCEQGVCGTCVTRVLEGIPEHRDYYLTNDEKERNDQFTPCCSRSKTPQLVIDL